MHIDIALDTFPYNGGTTTSEALWQGVPVIAFPGNRWVSRTSTSILKAARMDECIAADMADYIEKAVVFATRSNYSKKLRELRMNMRENLRKSIINDCSNFARNMEKIYDQIWLNHIFNFKQ
jgi:predicted O-linked N-acetylglucosamine transferase (SPINDLY family)